MKNYSRIVTLNKYLKRKILFLMSPPSLTYLCLGDFSFNWFLLLLWGRTIAVIVQMRHSACCEMLSSFWFPSIDFSKKSIRSCIRRRNKHENEDNVARVEKLLSHNSYINISRPLKLKIKQWRDFCNKIFAKKQETEWVLFKALQWECWTDIYQIIIPKTWVSKRQTKQTRRGRSQELLYCTTLDFCQCWCK